MIHYMNHSFVSTIHSLAPLPHCSERWLEKCTQSCWIVPFIFIIMIRLTQHSGFIHFSILLEDYSILPLLFSNLQNHLRFMTKIIRREHPSSYIPVCVCLIPYDLLTFFCGCTVHVVIQCQPFQNCTRSHAHLLSRLFNITPPILPSFLHNHSFISWNVICNMLKTKYKNLFTLL